MNWLALLDRIGVTGGAADLLTLQSIQRRALLTLPFENLDIHLGRPIRLDLPALYRKVVAGRRGGFCFELNECLFQCLSAMGYHAERLEGCVELGGPGQPFDHQCVLVRLDGIRWVADIGFGDSTLVPLNLDSRDAQSDGRSAYRVGERDGLFHVDRQWRAGEWSTMLKLNPQPQPWPAFAPRCHWHQTSPESAFVRKRLCTLATPEGRITLTGNTLRTTGASEGDEEIDEPAYCRTLADRFGVHIGSPTWQSPLV